MTRTDPRSGGSSDDDGPGGSARRPVGRRALLGGLGACAFCAAAYPVRSVLGPPVEPAGAAAPGRVDTRATPAAPTGLIVGVDTDEPVVGLSFDDGPDPQYTPLVLDLLARRRATATFFTVGVNALAHPDLIARHLDAGHSLANHTYDHPDLSKLSVAEVDAEIERGTTAIQRSGAPRPKLFRPPRGYAKGVIGSVVAAERYTTVYWTQCVEHFVNHQPVPHGVARLLGEVDRGSIILAHDGGHVLAADRPFINRSRTMTALPVLLDGLARRGLRVVDLPTLLRSGTPIRVG